VPRHGVPITPRVSSQDAAAPGARIGNRFQDLETCLVPQASLHNNRSRFYPILALKLESGRSPTFHPGPSAEPQRAADRARHSSH
jgi:hypothetical protein